MAPSGVVRQGETSRSVEYIHRLKMYTRVSRETCVRETGRATIKTGWAETDKRQKGQPNTCARGESRRNTGHTQDQSRRRQALKVLLSEIATG